MNPYRIRLRGPWDCEPLARRIVRAGQVEMVSEDLPAARSMTMPCRWGEGGLGDFIGRVRFRRRFGLPRQIDANETLWIAFAGVEGVAEIWLNGVFLGRHEGTQPFEYEVTGRLGQRNALIVEVESDTPHGGLWGEVALEIRYKEE
jgi:beta-galactosidase/beta-glucuronidase